MFRWTWIVSGRADGMILDDVYSIINDDEDYKAKCEDVSDGDGDEDDGNDDRYTNNIIIAIGLVLF